jgi:hypothetical protein
VYLLPVSLRVITTNYFITSLVDCEQCYCREIREMLIFCNNFSSLQIYNTPDHPTRMSIVEYRREDKF